jgi:hypothetical protein
MYNVKNQREIDLNYFKGLEGYFNSSKLSTLDKLKSFTRFVPLTEFSKFIVKYELFQKILNVNGSIIECGVHNGGGIFTWAILSSIFEPVNHSRKVFGFDTFSGFSNLDDIDIVFGNEHSNNGGLAVDSFDELIEGIELYDNWRPLGHIQKIKLVKGDAIETIPNFLKNNPQLVVAMLYLDFDVFKPTKIALELLFKRIPKGGLIVFDELNNEMWPGETAALNEVIGIFNLEIKRFPIHPHISYAII